MSNSFLSPNQFALRAHALRRAFAFIIDVAILVVVEYGLLVAGFVLDWNNRLPFELTVICAYAFSLIYFSVELFGLASLGKLMLGVRIASANPRPLGFVRRLVRVAAKLTPLLLFLAATLLAASISYDVMHFLFLTTIAIILFLGDAAQLLQHPGQTLHDRIARTLVIRPALDTQGFAVITR